MPTKTEGEEQQCPQQDGAERAVEDVGGDALAAAVFVVKIAKLP